MKQVSWRRVTAALVKLGCVVYGETEFAVRLHRGGVVIALIRKIDPVPVGRQKKIIETFGFDEQDYIEALAATAASTD